MSDGPTDPSEVSRATESAVARAHARSLAERRAEDPETWDRLLRMYRDARTIAVVGASRDETRPSFRIPSYLREQGYRIIPVSPRGGELFGERVRASLADIHEPIDIVDVFRPSAETPEIAREAVAAGAKVLWLQKGIENEEAREIAESAGLQVVMDRCLGVTHRWLGLGPGPD
jgi:predicted CoA-binding protein